MSQPTFPKIDSNPLYFFKSSKEMTPSSHLATISKINSSRLKRFSLVSFSLCVFSPPIMELYELIIISNKSMTKYWNKGIKNDELS